MQTIQADIVVIGAGPAGICAAVSAARLGVKTILVGNRPMPGGNSGSDIRVWTRGATGGGSLFAEEMGVWGDFKMRNLYANPDGNPVLWDDVLLDLCLQQKNLTLLLNVNIDRIEKDENWLTSVSGWQLGSEKEYRLFGKMFIDCTGDGFIGARAGVPFAIGKESQSQYGESFAPDAPDAATQGHSLLYYVKKCDHPVPYVPPSYAYDIETVEKLSGPSRVIKEEYGGSDYWWFEYGGNRDAIGDSQEITLELRRLVTGVWNYIKNSGKFSAENYTLEWMGGYGGKRESRRMVTDHVLCQSDLLEQPAFHDGAFYGGWFIDFHPPAGFESGDDSCRQIPVNLYEIPLRCLYSGAVPNLLFAGRDIGASHVAFASTRIMNTCALSGQAAGTAAAWCVQSGATTDAIGPDAVTWVRRTLQREDMLLLRYPNDDPDDLARAAAVSASSFFDGACGPSTGALPLSDACFVTFPAPERWDVRLLVNASHETTLRGVYYLSDLPSRFKPGAPVGRVEMPVPAGDGQWISLPAPDPKNARGFLTLLLEPNPDVSIATESRQRTGLLCGYPDQAEDHYPCVDAGYARLYAPENVINGYHRPWEGPNLWIAGDEPEPWLQLRWDFPQKIQEVRLYCNPDLCREIPSSRAAHWAPGHRFAARDGMPPELARTFRIEAKAEGKWRTVARETQNFRRMAVVALPAPVETDALRVVFEENYAGGRAQLFEIRVYRREPGVDHSNNKESERDGSHG